MKTVILFRHGKSDWNAAFGSDHDRPVAPRGIKAARAMGRWLTNTDQAPDYLITSSAVRARTSVELAHKAGKWKAPPVITDELYEANVEDYIRVLRRAPDDAAIAVVAGHEPTCSLAVSYLIGGGRLRFPTAAMARIDFAVENWKDIDAGLGTLIWFVPPRFLPG